MVARVHRATIYTMGIRRYLNGMLLKYLEENKHRVVTSHELYKQMYALSPEDKGHEIADLKAQPNIGTWWDTKTQTAYWRFYVMSPIEIARRKAVLRHW